MPARQSSIPSNLILDRSFIPAYGVTWAPTVTGSSGSLTTTDTENFRDGDLTTYTQIESTNSTIATGGHTILIDYGKIYSNCQLSYKIDFNTEARSGAYTIGYSIDDVNYTTLVSSTTGGSTATETTSTLLTAKAGQLKRIRITLSAADTIGLAITTKIYELRLLGSG